MSDEINKKKKYGVVVATPCYGGMINEGYLHGILQTQQVAAKNDFHMILNTMGNESLVTRARNTLVAQFLDLCESDPHDRFTHLMFIDADIGFEGKNIWRLLDSGHDIACGVYARKSVDWNNVVELAKKGDFENMEQKSLGYNLNFVNPKDIKMKSGFVEVLDAATGFMCIKKEVFYKMMKAYPNLKYTSDQIINTERFTSKNTYAFFDCIIDEKSNRYLSEDYAFCRMWQKIGGKIHADLLSPLTHWGTYAFKGYVWSKFTVAPGDKKDGNDVLKSKE